MTANRPNFTWPVLVIGVGVIVLLISAEALPEAYGDLLIRAWPVLLIMFGLNVLLGGRIRYANWIILGLSVAFVVIIANFAYAERNSEYRDDYQDSWQTSFPPEVEQLIVQIEAKDTRVALSNSAEPREALVEFRGSSQSTVAVDVTINGTTATYSIIETRPSILPLLSETGRGELLIYLPWEIFIQELNYVSDDGPVTLDFSQLAIRQLNAEVKRGHMMLCLPEQALTDNFVLIGNTLSLGNGNLRMVVPPNLTLSLETNNDSEPTYIPEVRAGDYVFLFGGGLESRGVQNNQFNVFLSIDVSGEFILDHERQCQENPS